MSLSHHSESFAEPSAAEPSRSKPSSAAAPRRARLVVSSAHGVVEVDLEGARFVGVLDVPGSLVGVGDALPMKLLCRADNAYPYVVEDPQDVVVHVIAVDDADVVGERQLLAPGLGLIVALSRPDHHLAPPLPVVVGASLDDAIANMLAEQLEPADVCERQRCDDELEEDEFDDEPDVITGSLRRLPLAELVQALSFARKTAAIHLRVRGGVGVIYLDDGEVACAQLDDDPRRAVARGAPAFARMLACEHGSFRVSFEREWHERNVKCSTQALLLDGLRQLDEARRARAAPPRKESNEEELVEIEELPVRPAMRSSTSTGSAAGFNVVLAAPRSSTR